MLIKTIVLGILAGTTIGAAAIQEIHAQAKPPTYVLAPAAAFFTGSEVPARDAPQSV
jgi:hypothetical protein